MRTINCYLLELNSAYIDKLKLSNGMELIFESRYGENARWNVTTEAKVLHVPLGVKDVQQGDEVCISYRVASKKIFPNNATQFYPAKVSQDGSYQEYLTSTGFHLRIIAFKTTSNFKQWTGVLTYNGQWVDGVQGSESDMERWKAQFPFGNKTKFIYSNLVEVDGAFYWKAGAEDILAKKEGDKIISISDRIICKPVETDVTQRYNIINGVHLPDKTLMQVHYGKGVVISNAHSTTIKEGDIIGFPHNLVEKYTLWGEEYLLINKKFVHTLYENS
jgi:co-chaperonin GroES (HSP10)